MMFQTRIAKLVHFDASAIILEISAFGILKEVETWFIKTKAYQEQQG